MTVIITPEQKEKTARIIDLTFQFEEELKKYTKEQPQDPVASTLLLAIQMVYFAVERKITLLLVMQLEEFYHKHKEKEKTNEDGKSSTGTSSNGGNRVVSPSVQGNGDSSKSNNEGEQVSKETKDND